MTGVLSAVVALGSGLLGGLYLAFSVAVLPALRRRPAAEAEAVMRAVNGAILNPVFGVLFGGTGLAATSALAVVVSQL